MACFDTEQREIVLRIVYDGPATAGKTANLRSLYDSLTHRAMGELFVPAETKAGRTLCFDWLELMAGYLDDWPLRCQILTVPGQFAFAERRFRLLQGLDAVVFVCDSTPRGVTSARVAWAFLGKALAPIESAGTPIVVQANKQDLPGALSPLAVRAELGLGASRTVVPASATTHEGVRPTFFAALDAARERARSAVRRSGPEALPPPMEGAGALYAAMMAQEGAEPDPAMVHALEAALRSLEDE